MSDLHALLREARGEELGAAELSSDYSAVERAELLAVLRHMGVLTKVLLEVNRTYIASASQEDRFRTEPPFKLQGSYRNMAKLADKVVPAMTEADLHALLDAHYAAEAQTLTTSAEANLLKLAELRGRPNVVGSKRWAEIKQTFARTQVTGGKDADPAVRITGALTLLQSELSALRAPLEKLASETKAAALPEPRSAATGDASDTLRAAAAVSQRLDALREAMVAIARQAAAPAATPAPPAAPAVDQLSPQFERLAMALHDLAQRPAQVVRPWPRLGGLPDELANQLALVAEALVPIAELAKGGLQSGNGGTVSAVSVWKHVKQAIDILEAARRTDVA